MATKKPEIEEQNDDMILLDDPTTVKVADGRQKYNGPMVPDVYLPPLEEEGSGVKVDQYEHVTIANEEKEEHWKIRRGVRQDLPVPVYVVLKQSGRYPNL